MTGYGWLSLTWRPDSAISTRPPNWLTRCEQARPDDVDVWNARLRWATGGGPTRRVSARRQVICPRRACRRPRVLCASCLARRRESVTDQAERSALEELVRVEPADIGDDRAPGRPRGAEWREGRGSPTLRRQQVRHRGRRRPVQAAHQPSGARPAGRPSSPARAEAIGRRYDAKIWWRIRSYGAIPSLENEASSAQARLSKTEPPAVAARWNACRTCSDRLASRASPHAHAVTSTLKVPTYRRRGRGRAA